MIRGSHPLLAAALLAAALSTAPGLAEEVREAPPAGSLFLYPERIALDDGRGIEAERGMLFVPAVRAEPQKGTLGVEIYRFRSGAAAGSGAPPIFLLHGGPGWPGLGSRLEQAEYFDSRLRPFLDVADLVVVGQRGIGSSKPDTACGRPPEPEPGTQPSEEEREAAMMELAERCREFWTERGLALEGLNVIEAAGDVADAAAALGYPEIVVWGGSFGSHWGMAVMRYHPEIVARAVLNGLEGPDHTYDMPGGVLAGLERIAGAAEADPRLGPLIPEGGLLAAFRAVVGRAEREPIVVSVPDPESGELREVRLTAEDMRGLAMGSSGSARSRRGLPRWPREILDLHAGDFRAAAERKLGSGRRFPTASFFMLDCGSGISRARAAELAADPAAATVGETGGFYDLICPIWESDLGEGFRAGFRTEIPTVLVHGDWDLSTPFTNALELVPSFPKGRLIVVEGGTHGALREAMQASEGFREGLMEFARSGEVSGLPEKVVLPPIEWELPEADEADEAAEADPEQLLATALAYLRVAYVECDFEAMASYFTPESVWEDPSMAYFGGGPKRIVGGEAIVDFYRRGSLGGGIETRFEVENHFVVGDRVALDVLFTSRGDGVHLGFPGVELEGTMRGFTVLRIVDGKVLHHLDHVDYAEMMRQAREQAAAAAVP